MKFTTLLSVLSLTVLAGAASAQMMVVNRGLPDANLNNAAGSSRSNVSWAWSYGNDGIEGDDFTLPTLGAGQSWKITGIRTWFLTSGAAYTWDSTTNKYVETDTPADTNPGNEFSDVRLMTGAPGGTLSLTASGNFTGDLSTDNSNISVTPVKYADGESYQGTSGDFVQIYQVDFNNLSIAASGGQSLAFGVIGTSKEDNGGYFGWFNHASNAALGGVPADSADGQVEEFNFGGQFVDYFNSNGNGWDKSSDINVQVFAQAVPEPNEFAFLGLAGLGLIGTMKRKLRKS